MAKSAKPLSVSEIKNAKPKEKLYKMYDGLGMYLAVAPTGKKVWRFDYTDKESYFTVNIDGRPSKWICRLYIKEKVNYMVVLDGKEYIRYDFKEINDLYQFANIFEKRAAEIL